tara:strand:- start:3902 stop:4426 length:525 start_codon:yes stop_codon:yes gene_type:complete
MPITIKESSNKQFSEGWQSVVVREAEVGDYNGSKFVDLRFTDFPDSLKCRVWEAKNKDGEEFSISNMIRYSNPDILEHSTAENGSMTAQVDDSAASLNGKAFQVYLYKKANGYMEVSQKVAPSVPFQNVVESYDLERINRIKTSAEEYTKKRNETVPTSLNETTSTQSEEIPSF